MNQKSGHRLSTHERTNDLHTMALEQFDVLVVGGGITGCGIALDAAQRGLKVGLVEMQDFASGTSSRSTKLIHGGLRYLKQGEVNLVREVGRERAVLHQHAPHVVRPEPMLLPLVKGGTYGKWATSFGLWLYDRLAGVQKAERRLMLSKEETLEREPLLKKEGLKGSGLYVEYRTDDARLTMEVIKTAVKLGAIAVNYCQVTEFTYNDHTVNGIRVHDRVHDKQYTIRAKKIVNAAGPWVDELREKDRSLQGKRLHLTKGIHIVVDGRRFPLQQATYFDVADGRMIFAIPRDGKTYIGTTDTSYDGELSEPPMTDEDRDYLLRATNAMFPSVSLTAADVESYWSGLRPLIHEDGKSPSQLSRKDEIFRSPSGLITIAGGKLTGFRKMAEKVVDIVTDELGNDEGRTFPPCRTDEQVLSGGHVGGPDNWDAYVAEFVHTYGGSETRLTETDLRMLAYRYGSNAPQVVQHAQLLQNDVPGDGMLRLAAELAYGVQEEMVVYSDDFLCRRTGMAYFDRAKYENTQSIVSEWLQAMTVPAGGSHT